MSAKLPYRPRLEPLEDRLTPATLLPGFTQTPLAGGLSQPTAFTLVPDGRIFVAEQGGNVRVVQGSTLLATPLLSVSVDADGERGLLGITVDPNFASNHFVYVYYTTASTPIHNRLSRFTANGNTVVAGSEVVLLELNDLSAFTNHNGGAIHFGIDGKLYVGVGENANAANAQSLNNLLGKLLRLNPDGSIPADNPFVNVASGVNRAIWALGLRNPFTFAIQPGTGRIFINDVGAGTFEEINDGSAGANYGWPQFEGPGGSPTFREPLFAYPHGEGTTNGNAIAGGAFYNPATVQFPSDFVGDYFFADFTNDWIRRFDPVSGAVTLFASDLLAGPVDLRVDAAGSLYYLARGMGATTGMLFRVDSLPPAGPTPPASQPLNSSQRFINALYERFLGRSGALAELDGWVARLGTDGQAAVIAAIQRSTEGLTRVVEALYQHLLGRPAEEGGKAGWVEQLQRGATLEGVIAGFVSTAEFAARADTLFGSASSERNFVQALYQVLLRRQGNGVTETEISGWLARLATQDRRAVALGFVGSLEFRRNAVRTFYGDPTLSPLPFLPFLPNLLRRTLPPGEEEQVGWIGSPQDLFTIEVGFAASLEFFATA